MAKGSMFFDGKWSDQPYCGYIANRMVYGSWKYIYIYTYITIYSKSSKYSAYIYIYRFPGHDRINQWDFIASYKSSAKRSCAKPSSSSSTGRPSSNDQYGLRTSPSQRWVLGLGAMLAHMGDMNQSPRSPDGLMQKWMTYKWQAWRHTKRIVSSSNDLKAKPRNIFHKNAVKLVHFNLCVGWCSYWWSITLKSTIISCLNPYVFWLKSPFWVVGLHFSLLYHSFGWWNPYLHC